MKTMHLIICNKAIVVGMHQAYMSSAILQKNVVNPKTFIYSVIENFQLCIIVVFLNLTHKPQKVIFVT